MRKNLKIRTGGSKNPGIIKKLACLSEKCYALTSINFFILSRSAFVKTEFVCFL